MMRPWKKDAMSTVSINEAKIQEEARYDGKYIFRTNTELPTTEVAQTYKQLWMVERAFSN